MTKDERAAFTRLAETMYRIGEDLAKGKLEPDQAAKWIRLISLRIRFGKRGMLRSATWNWLDQEVRALNAYEYQTEVPA